MARGLALKSYARDRQKMDANIRSAQKWFRDFSENAEPGEVDVYDDGADLEIEPPELELGDVPLDPARKRSMALGVGLTFLGFGVIVALVAGTRPGGFLRKTLPAVPGLDPAFVALAAKWAAAYGLPLQWVLATILAESNGDPNIVGDYHVDPQGASIGLMQINSVAHAAELAAAGLTRASLFNPDINIQWGAKILRKCVDRVRAALAGRPGDVGLLARLCYTGVNTPSSIAAGQYPYPLTCPSCPTSATRWQERLAQTAMAA